MTTYITAITSFLITKRHSPPLPGSKRSNAGTRESIIETEGQQVSPGHLVQRLPELRRGTLGGAVGEVEDC